MLVHIDENVPDSVAKVFRQRGHDVFLVRELHPRGTPDPAVARVAMEAGAVVVTWDKDFRSLATRPSYRTLHVITFDCPSVEGARRAQEAMKLIEFQYEQVVIQNNRLLIEVLTSVVRIGV